MLSTVADRSTNVRLFFKADKEKTDQRVKPSCLQGALKANPRALRAVVEVDGAGQRRLGLVLDLDASAVAQLLRGVSEAMEVSVMQEVHAVCPHQPPPGRPVGHTAAGAAGQVQRAAHVGGGPLGRRCCLLIG